MSNFTQKCNQNVMIWRNVELFGHKYKMNDSQKTSFIVFGSADRNNTVDLLNRVS